MAINPDKLDFIKFRRIMDRLDAQLKREELERKAKREAKKKNNKKENKNG